MRSEPRTPLGRPGRARKHGPGLSGAPGGLSAAPDGLDALFDPAIYYHPLCDDPTCPVCPDPVQALMLDEPPPAWVSRIQTVWAKEVYL